MVIVAGPSTDSGNAPDVRIIDGRVVRARGVGPVPLVWLPLDGHVVAKIPARKGNRRWLHETVRIRSPRLAGDRWHLPRNCLVRLVTASIDRYGYAVVWRDMSRLSRCAKSCQEASGLECDCSCRGLQHGKNNSGAWFEGIGDVMVADCGEYTRSAMVFGAKTDTSDDFAVYRGEMTGRLYCADPRGRQGWPKASRFICACCMSVRARVWDHCHTHGYVRGPLCNACNTRHWTGWHPRFGRAFPSHNLDTSYYLSCPGADSQEFGRCSA